MRIMNLEVRLKGQITVYAALSLVLILSLIAVCFQSAGVSYQKAFIDASCRLSTESLFAAYNSDMLEEFDIFVLSNSDNLESEYQELLLNNLDMQLDSGDVVYQNTYLTDEKMITDDCGSYLEQQVIEYMNYTMAEDLVAQITDATQKEEQAEAVEQINQQITEYSDGAVLLNEKVLELVRIVEGIKTTSDGFVSSGGGPVATGEYFAKACLGEEPNMDNTAISDNRIYSVMTGSYTKYTNAVQLIAYMNEDLAEAGELSAEAQAESDEYSDYMTSYSMNWDQLNQLLQETYNATDQALDLITEYEQQEDVIQSSGEQCISSIEGSRQELGEDLYSSLIENVQSMVDDESEESNSLCDIEELKAGLEDNLILLEEMKLLISQVSMDQASQDKDNTFSRLEELSNLVGQLDNSRLKFDYSQIEFQSTGSGLEKVKNVLNTIKDGITSIVLEGKEISDKSIEYTDLATSLINQATENQNASSDDATTNGVINSGIFGEYILDKFQSFTDYLNEDGSVNTDTSHQLDYMIEYIICNEQSDKSNLGEIMLKISAIREVINLTYLLTNVEKKNEAFALAGTLVGFTGNMALIKAAQYLILTAWAYGESVVELKQLFQGGKIPLVKNTSNWNLSLDRLMALDLDVNQDNTQDGISYEQYLRVLLLLESRVKKYYSTMGAMELKMIELGNEGFRMNHYLVSLTSVSMFQISNVSSTYTRKISFGYV